MTPSPIPIELDNLIALPPDVLEPMSDQPRTAIEEEAIREIGESAVELRSRGLGKLGTGFIDVLTVRLPSGALHADGSLKEGARLPIIGGETRWRGCLYAQEKYGREMLPFLPCVVENIPPGDAFELSFLANLLRRNYSELDEAMGYLRLKNAKKYTYEQLAAKVKKSIGYIQNKVDVAGAPDTHVLFDGRKGALYMARRLSTIKEPAVRAAMIERTLKERPLGEEVDEWIRAYKSGLSTNRLRAIAEVQEAEQSHRREARAANRQGTGGQGSVSSNGNGFQTYSLPAYDPVLALDAVVTQILNLKRDLRDKNLPHVTKAALRESALKLKIEVDVFFDEYGTGKVRSELEVAD